MVPQAFHKSSPTIHRLVYYCDSPMALSAAGQHNRKVALTNMKKERREKYWRRLAKYQTFNYSAGLGES